MTTMLEKAAFAMWKEIAHIEEPDIGDFEAGLRAALMAIREPDLEVERAGEASDTPGYATSAATHWTAMIDAILAEGPTNG